jgi:putative addiction module component (TIGR02574 family)
MRQLSPQAAEVLDKALALSSQERGLLIDRLVESLDEGPPDEGVEEAWKIEIKRRVDDIDAGKADMMPLEEVRRRIGAKRRDESC